MTKRDPIDVFLLWLMIGSLFLMALCVLAISPLAYLWLMGIVGSVVTLMTTLILAGIMCNDGFIGCMFAGDVIRFGFEIVGAIFGAIADASK